MEGLFNDTNYLAARKMLDYTSLRHEALASNMANIEVAGYKRVDVASVDFQKQLSEAMHTGSAQSFDKVQPKIVVDHTASASTRTDGNNVEMDRELMQINSNELEYEYLTKYISHNYQLMRTAISTQI
ncbi:MAG: flagellar basal body rod protein FlgB [Opitutales bacterium]|nr:flagellar basal body rod protein FlgB [Opitutales bacterium]